MEKLSKKIVQERILRNFLDNLSYFADKDYQERVWVRAEGPECDDLDNRVNDFFDLGESIFGKQGDYGLTQKQHKVLCAFRDDLDHFLDNPLSDYNAKLFIDSPEWTNIIEKAKFVLKTFEFKEKAPQAAFTEFIPLLHETLDLEKEVWVFREGPEEKNIDKIICNLFETVEIVILNFDQLGLSNQQRIMLDKFNSKLENFLEDYELPSPDMYKPEWQEIKSLGYEILSELEANT